MLVLSFIHGLIQWRCFNLLLSLAQTEEGEGGGYNKRKKVESYVEEDYAHHAVAHVHQSSLMDRASFVVDVNDEAKQDRHP